MPQIVLQEGILEKIKSNPQLFAEIAVALGVSIYTLPKILKEKDQRLTQANVLRILREHLGEMEDKELLEEMDSTAKIEA